MTAPQRGQVDCAAALIFMFAERRECVLARPFFCLGTGMMTSLNDSILARIRAAIDTSTDETHVQDEKKRQAIFKSPAQDGRRGDLPPVAAGKRAGRMPAMRGREGGAQPGCPLRCVSLSCEPQKGRRWIPPHIIAGQRAAKTRFVNSERTTRHMCARRGSQLAKTYRHGDPSCME